ncbi:hypothetical protein [Sphingobacterium griseoflavum]|uniref:Phage ABA sandwich domain-containing protein n=1 Tax=Sphingobacterium griseoflavum TaxID=1474952 RepID=A0ABQ3HZJ0_9SPHI|nr:hypothetical protein [Sphingobacterium griseoflavum]GHE35009.1 hypothetical protein GCM10017764_17760 [Sphingobacterium griseoflavum]
MILTDKARKDFNHYRFEVLKDSIDKSYGIHHRLVINNLIIQWLDTVGIMIEYVYCAYTNSWQGCLVKSDIHFPKIYFEGVDTEAYEYRQEATEAAIKLANEIYNKRV